MRRSGLRAASRAVLTAALAGILLAPALADQAEGESEPSAKRIAGRWRITLEGLQVEHEEILASFAVDGGLLIGTLTVGRQTVSIASGKVVGLDFSFTFEHVSGERFRMRGTADRRGLSGIWEARNEKGKWRASRLHT